MNTTFDKDGQVYEVEYSITPGQRGDTDEGGKIDPDIEDEVEIGEVAAVSYFGGNLFPPRIGMHLDPEILHPDFLGEIETHIKELYR